MHRQAWGKFLGVTGSLVLSSTVPVLAQTPPASTTPPASATPPASTYKPGYWQPVARVNPHSPITLTLMNQTNSPLAYNFLDGHGETTLPVGVSIQIKNISLPNNIAIYNASPKAAAGRDGGLKYETSVTKNDINVIILPVTTSGFHVINISKGGGIYVY